MSNRIEVLSRSLQKALAETLIKVLPGHQIEINDLLFDRNGQTARVWLKTKPATLALVKTKYDRIIKELAQHWRMRYVPRLSFLIDDNYLDNMDELFDKIKSDEP